VNIVAIGRPHHDATRERQKTVFGGAGGGGGRESGTRFELRLSKVNDTL